MECVRTRNMSCPTICKIFSKVFLITLSLQGDFGVKEIWKVHYTAPRRVAYLNFKQSSGKPGHLESRLVAQGVYKNTATYRLVKTPRFWPIFSESGSQTVYSVSKNRYLPRSRSTAVSAGIKKPNKRSDYRFLKKPVKIAVWYTVIYRGFFGNCFPWVLR